MKRCLIVIYLVTWLMMLSAGLAQALETWIWEGVPGDPLSWQLKYDGTAGESWTTWYCDFEIDFQPPGTGVR